MMSQLLKEQTRPLHKAVEALNPVLTPQFNTHFYKDYLSLLAAYYDHFEAQFEKWNSVVPSELQLLRRMKLEKINADLKNLGAFKGQLKFEIPPITTRAEFWGHFYVLEGSTLGGQIISRKLSERLSLSDNQLQFFNSYKEQTGPMWKSFIEVLDSQEFTDAEKTDLLHSANEGFKTYGLLLEQIQSEFKNQET